MSLKQRIDRLEQVAPVEDGEQPIVLQWPGLEKRPPSPEVVELMRRWKAAHPGRVGLFWPDGSEATKP